MTTHPVFALEQAAMARWCKGDPDGFLEISANDVTYFDPFIPRRLNGIEALRQHYDGIRGKVFASHYEFIDVLCQEMGEDIAILTYHFHSGGSEGAMRWNCTEVFRRNVKDSWEIVQTHWSIRGNQ